MLGAPRTSLPFPAAMQASTPRILVLGAGRVGSAIVKDLARDETLRVDVADLDPERANVLPSSATFHAVNLRDAGALQSLVEPFDLVIGAVPGWMGFETVRTVLQCGKNVVDISFFEEDPYELHDLAQERGLTCVVDCGVAPGLSNLFLGRLQEEFDSMDAFLCYVGGLPQEPKAPWNYKAPYSPTDVIEMYTRPARLVREGQVITMPALTESEMLEFPDVGALEAFNTDGLRTLLRCEGIPDLREKTLRYPGHRLQVEALAASGFFDDEREVNGETLRPRELSAKLLMAEWFQGEKDYDVTVMRLVAEGKIGGRALRRTYDLIDYADREGAVSSMARTTGYPCTAVARLVLAGRLQTKGIVPPETIGKDKDLFDAVMDELAKRDVTFQLHEEDLPEAVRS